MYNIKRNTAAILLLLFIVVMFSSRFNKPVNGAEDISIDLECSDKLKLSKKFSVFLSIESRQPIGAVEAVITYPDTAARFKKYVLEDKTSDDFIDVDPMEGRLHFIYAAAGNDMREKRIAFEFESLTEDDIEIKAQIKEAVSYDNTVIAENKNCSLSVTYENDEVSERSVSETLSVSESSSRTEKKKESRQSSSSKKSSVSSKASKSKEKSSSSKVSGASSSVSQSSKIIKQFDKNKYKDNLSDESVVYYIIGGIVAIAVTAAAAISFVRRINKKYAE